MWDYTQRISSFFIEVFTVYMYMSVCDAWGTSRSAGTPVRVHVPAGDLHTSVSLVAAGRVGGERAIVTGERARGLSSVLWRNVR